MNPYEKLALRPVVRVHYDIEHNLAEDGLKPAAQAQLVADILGSEYKSRIDYYKRILLKMPADSPDRETLTPEYIHENSSYAMEAKHVLQDRAENVGWSTLQMIAENNPAEAIVVLDAIKEVARRRLVVASHAAAAVGVERSPYEQSHFGLILQAFEDDWQPRGAIEQTMLEMMVQYYIKHNYWLAVSTDTESAALDRSSGDNDDINWLGPRLKPADLIDRATGYADKYNRLFLRTLRQLRDLRRYPMVINNNGGQVNVANQQVNMQEGQK